MEKLLYPVWKPESLTGDDFREQLLDSLAPSLLEEGVAGLRIAVVDSDVAPAAGLRQEKLGRACDGLVSIWMDSAVYRQPLEEIIQNSCESLCGYLVTESSPLPFSAPPGERTEGMTQVVFLERPDHLTEKAWLEVWLGSHTAIAIATQSTFAYRQNVVVRPLTPDAPVVHAIVEESFPAAAMTSPHAFYDVDSDEALQANVKAMIDSCSRFIDFDRINVVPTSEYPIK